MDYARDVSSGSVERMLHILRTESKELARVLADEEITPPQLIHSLITANVITTAHVRSILALDHTTQDKYTCLLKNVETVIATSISNGSLDDTAILVKNFISTLLDNNLRTIAIRLHPELAVSLNGCDTVENGSAFVPDDAPRLNTNNELPNKPLGSPTNLPYPSRPTEKCAFPFTPTLPSTASFAAVQSSPEENTSYSTASSGDSASPHTAPSKSYPMFGNIQFGGPCNSVQMFGEQEALDAQSEMGMNIVVEYNKEVFGPMDDESSDDETYRNSSKPRGLVFIANYSSFKNGCHDLREGSDVDVKNLCSLFEKMGYLVPTIPPDMTKAGTLNALREFRDDKRHEAAHSCVVIIMSHGKNDNSFFTADGLSLRTADILELFSNMACKALINKPKLFILQFCRGGRKAVGVPVSNKVSMALGKVMQIDSAYQGHTKELISNKPILTDMLLVYSTVEGYVSFRDPRHGSWLIKDLCQVFMKHACNCNLDQLLKKVSKLVSDRESDEGKKQSCEMRSISVNKNFYFNPTATFDETRSMCVGTDGSGGGCSTVDAEANGSLAVGAGGVTNSSTVVSSLRAEDPVVASPGRLSSQREVLTKQPLNNSSETNAPHHPALPPGDVFTFKDTIDLLPPLPNNYTVILKACPSPGDLDSSCKLSGEDEEGEFDDSGITSNSSDLSSFGGGGGAGGSISSLEPNNLRRKSSTEIMREPNGSGFNCRQAEKSYSISSEGDVSFLPPECFIRRDSEVSVSLDIGMDDSDVDSLVLGSIDDSLMDA